MDMVRMFIANSNVSNVLNVPCSMCFSINHAHGECVENGEENAWNYVPLYSMWNRHGNDNYRKDSLPPYHPKSFCHQHNQHQSIEENFNDSNLEDVEIFKVCTKDL